MTELSPEYLSRDQAPRRIRRIPPVLLLGAATVTQHLLASPARPRPAAAAAAAPVAIASGYLLAGSIREFARHHTTVNPSTSTSQTRSCGPTPTRTHETRLGMTGMLTSHAILRSSPAALLPVLALGTWLNRVQIPAEEAALTREFSNYPAYQASTPRWLPNPAQRRRANQPNPNRAARLAKRVLLKGSLLEYQGGLGRRFMTFETDDDFRTACTFG